MSIFEYDKEEEERKLRKAEYTVRLHIAKSSCAILENLK